MNSNLKKALAVLFSVIIAMTSATAVAYAEDETTTEPSPTVSKAEAEKMKKTAKKEVTIILKNTEIRRLIMNTKVELNEFKANVSIGTEDYVITSYLIGIISAILSNILARAKFGKKQKISKTVIYSVQPIYQPQNIYSVKMNIKVATKISHLLYIALMLAKTTKQYESFNENSKAKKDKNIMKNIEKRNAQAV